MAQNPAQQAPAGNCNELHADHETRENQGNLPPNANGCTYLHNELMGDTGHELSSKSLDKPPVSDNASAKCGAVGAKTGAIDAIANAIKSLSDTERQQLINLMQQKGQTP